jgi:hypothetical protein
VEPPHAAGEGKSPVLGAGAALGKTGLVYREIGLSGRGGCISLGKVDVG